MFQLYLHRSVLGFTTAVLTCLFGAKGCKKRTPSFVAISDTQVNSDFPCFLFSVRAYELLSYSFLWSCSFPA